MEGIPNELWRQLTSLIGATDGDSDDDDNDDGDRVVESCVDIDKDHKKNSEEETSISVNQKQRILNAKVEEHSSGRVSSSSDCLDNSEHTDQGVGEGPEDEDDDEDEAAVEIGLEECAMLRDSLQRKLDALISTQDRFVP